MMDFVFKEEPDENLIKLINVMRELLFF